MYSMWNDAVAIQYHKAYNRILRKATSANVPVIGRIVIQLYVKQQNWTKWIFEPFLCMVIIFEPKTQMKPNRVLSIAHILLISYRKTCCTICFDLFCTTKMMNVHFLWHTLYEIQYWHFHMYLNILCQISQNNYTDMKLQINSGEGYRVPGLPLCCL